MMMMVMMNRGGEVSSDSSGLAGFTVRHSSTVGTDRQSVQLSQQTCHHQH